MTQETGRMPHERGSVASRRRPAELLGWGLALVLSLGAVAWVAQTSDWLMFTDGDSVIVPMMVRSIVLGQPQDWAMSPVLFLPETVVYGVLSLLGLGMRATLVLNGVVNFVALYGALRLVAGRREAGRMPVTGALLAFAAFCMLVLLEGTAAAPGFQLATLLATTTYYSATVVAAVAVIGLVRRLLDGARPVVPLVAIAGVSLVSILTNPLFAVWAIGPICGVLLVLAVWRRIPWRMAAVSGAALVVGGGVGYLLRGLFEGTIVAAGDNYFRGDQWMRSRDYFGSVLGATATSINGVLWIVVVLALTVASGFVAVRAWRRGAPAVAFVAALAAAAPTLTTLGAIVLGSDADRYLQPWVFLPVTVLAIAPPVALARAAGRRMPVLVAGGVAAALVLGAAIPATVVAAARDDTDLDCVTGWVEASGRTGAGQFWTVRAPKAALDDPARLIQVDHTMRVYTWLTNRTDADGAEVTFLVQDAQTYPFQLPDGISLDQAEPVSCGRYTIHDFGDRTLPLGPPRN